MSAIVRCRGGLGLIACLMACAAGTDDGPTPFDTTPQPGSSAGSTASASSDDGATDDVSTTEDASATAPTSGAAETESSPDDTGTTTTATTTTTTTTTTSSSSSDDTPTYEPICGDGMAEEDEACDGDDLRGQTCPGLDFDGGVLGCLADCTAFDTSGCTVAPFCGDGIVNGTEQCDGADLAGQSCQSLGWDMGALACSGSCTFDTSNCANAPCTPVFGNCSQVPCCQGLVCLPLDGHHCAPL